MTNKKEFEQYELHLPYFKQGDDLQHYLQKAEGNTDFEKHANALTDHARSLRVAADMLISLAEHAKQNRLLIEFADTHMIGIECEPELGEVLIAEGVLEPAFDEDADSLDEDTEDENE